MTVLKVCIEPGCHRLTAATRCTTCQSRKDRARNRTSYYQTTEWRTLAAACIERDGNCVICGSLHRLTANHVIARTAGGPDALANLMTMCGPCHSSFEADVRHDRQTDLRRRVDEIRAHLIASRNLRARGDTS